MTKEEIRELPVAIFEGDIVVIDKDEQVDDAVSELAQQSVLGFDTETRPSFQKGVSYSVSLLQLSTENKSFLFRINKLGNIAPLARLLADKKIIKVGVAIRDDIKGLAKRKIKPANNFVELQDLSTQKGISDNSLQRIFAELYQGKISKRQRLSNWDASVLEHEKQLYAATDAWASLMIYQKLIAMPDCKIEKEEQE